MTSNPAPADYQAQREQTLALATIRVTEEDEDRALMEILGGSLSTSTSIHSHKGARPSEDCPSPDIASGPRGGATSRWTSRRLRT